MKPRCAVVCAIATGGGVTEAFLTSLDMLKSRGVVPVAIVPEGFHFLDRLTAAGHETVRLRGLERGGMLNMLRQAWQIANSARGARVDVLVLNNGRHVWAVKKLLPGVPLVAVYHGGKIERFLTADRIITINDEQLRYLADRGYPADRAVVVDNALPVDSLAPYVPKPRRSGSPVVGTLRLLEPAKGVDVLIEAIGLLAARGERFRARIGSSGSQEARLRARVNALGLDGLVEFVGWVDDKAAFFESLDIYVLPSRAEEWGIGIVEANAARLPVVATACLGPRRIVRDGETGLLVPTEDPVAMADAIGRLLADPALCERLARAAHARVVAEYLFPKIAPIFVDNILKAMKGDQAFRK